MEKRKNRSRTKYPKTPFPCDRSTRMPLSCGSGPHRHIPEQPQELGAHVRTRPRPGRSCCCCGGQRKNISSNTITSKRDFSFFFFFSGLPWFGVFGEGGQAAGVHVTAHINVDGRIGFCELRWSRNALVVQWRCRRSSDQRSWHIGSTVLQRDKQV